MSDGRIDYKTLREQSTVLGFLRSCWYPRQRTLWDCNISGTSVTPLLVETWKYPPTAVRPISGRTKPCTMQCERIDNSGYIIDRLEKVSRSHPANQLLIQSVYEWQFVVHFTSNAACTCYRVHLLQGSLVTGFTWYWAHLIQGSLVAGFTCYRVYLV